MTIRAQTGNSDIGLSNTLGSEGGTYGRPRETVNRRPGRSNPEAGGSTRIVGEIRFLQLLSLLRARFLPARFRV